MSEKKQIPVRPLVSSTRESLNLSLHAKEGRIPDDIPGYVFINTPNGSVNSALPYPKHTPQGTPNPEYNSPLLGGAGYVLKFDLNEPGKVKLTSSLLKTHSYYVDEATKFGTPHHKNLGFKNRGVARMSMALGAADQIGTALVPFKFKGDQQSRLLAASDVGRPYEINGHNFDIVGPLGKLKDYKEGTPPFLSWFFKIILGTAHPTFDPVTQELFTVNYTKSITTFMQSPEKAATRQDAPYVDEVLTKEMAQAGHKSKVGNQLAIQKVKNNFLPVGELSRLKKYTKKGLSAIQKKVSVDDAVYLMRFTDKTTHHRWRVINEQGENVKIFQCIHQTSLSKDYFILIDAAFKVSLDVLVNQTVPGQNKFNAFMRKITTRRQMTKTPVYLIKRSDLDTSQETVTAKRLLLSPEFIHFTANYANDDDLITLYTASNASGCLAEWVRSYDKLFPNTPIEAGTEGILCVGSMDVGRVGKVVIDANTGTIKEEKLVHKVGDLSNPKDIGPHTWLPGFYTFRDFISADQPVKEIKNIYWQFGSLERRRLTKFIYDLYKNYANRIVPAEEVKKYSQQGIPFQLSRMNTDTMEIEDYYQFLPDYNLGAVQFVSRKNATPDLDPSMDGYILCTMINGVKDEAEQMNYLREIWLFDGANLKQGPVCKLAHPDFNFGFNLHALWVPDIQTMEMEPGLNQEYKDLLEKVPPKFRDNFQEILEGQVFPHFTN